MQYADDTIFFSMSNVKNIFNLKTHPQTFALAYGHKINMDKNTFADQH